jgi:hypothetical protein
MGIEVELVEYKKTRRLTLVMATGRIVEFFMEPELPDLQKFYFKNEGFIGSDGATCSAWTVGEIRWDEEFDFAAFFAVLEAFGPTADHAAEWEYDGLIPFVGAVKLRAIEEGATVVDLDGVRGFR